MTNLNDPALTAWPTTFPPVLSTHLPQAAEPLGGPIPWLHLAPPGLVADVETPAIRGDGAAPAGACAAAACLVALDGVAAAQPKGLIVVPQGAHHQRGSPVLPAGGECLVLCVAQLKG